MKSPIRHAKGDPQVATSRENADPTLLISRAVTIPAGAKVTTWCSGAVEFRVKGSATRLLAKKPRHLTVIGRAWAKNELGKTSVVIAQHRGDGRVVMAVAEDWEGEHGEVSASVHENTFGIESHLQKLIDGWLFCGHDWRLEMSEPIHLPS